MVSMACGGTADRIAARIFCKVLRAGSGTPAKYSSTFFGRLWPRAVDLGLPDVILFIPARLGERSYTFESSGRCLAVSGSVFGNPGSRELGGSNAGVVARLSDQLKASQEQLARDNANVAEQIKAIQDQLARVISKASRHLRP